MHYKNNLFFSFILDIYDADTLSSLETVGFSTNLLNHNQFCSFITCVQSEINLMTLNESIYFRWIRLVHNHHVFYSEVQLLSPNLVRTLVTQILQVCTLVLQVVLDDDQIGTAIFSFTQIYLAKISRGINNSMFYLGSIPSLRKYFSALMTALS